MCFEQRSVGALPNAGANVSKEHPGLVSEFIEQAKEVEIGRRCKKRRSNCLRISENVEFAGVHSGECTIVFPPQKLYIETIRRIKKIARQICQTLEITGAVPHAVVGPKDNDIKSN
jgi:carbamoyl-phosphate synthase large subunit